MPERIFPTGEVLAYSNYGTALAGYIVEKVSGVPYNQYVEENIYNKLGMEYSTFEQPVPNHLAEHVVTAYRYVDGEFRKGAFEFVIEPAGSMSSSASDMAKFMLAYLQDGQYNGELILQAETVQQMFQQQFTHHPALDGMGLGFIRGEINEREIYYHEGSTMLFNSGMYLIPEENLGVFIAYSGGNFLLHKDVLQQVMDHYFPHEAEVIAETSLTSSTDLKKYSGEYQQNRRSETTVDKLLNLIVGTIQVKPDPSGYLNVTQMGKVTQYSEVEHGVFKSIRQDGTADPFGYFETLVFKEDYNGNMMLIADGPMSYSKAPIYATSGVNFLAIGISLLIIIVSLLMWIIKAIIHRFKKNSQAKNAIQKTVNWTAIIYGLLLISLIGTILFNEVDPVYQLPKDSYGMEPTWMSIFNVFPYILIVLTPILLILTLFIWKNKHGKLFERIHYSFYTIVAIFFTWFFVYWNFF